MPNRLQYSGGCYTTSHDLSRSYILCFRVRAGLPYPFFVILSFTSQQFCVHDLMVSALIEGNIHYINEKSRHYDVSTIRVHAENGHAPSHPCTDTDWRMLIVNLSVVCFHSWTRVNAHECTDRYSLAFSQGQRRITFMCRITEIISISLFFRLGFNSQGCSILPAHGI